MMAYSEDHIALAAEYALGTLDADERAQVETMMAVDTEFSAIVRAWEYRLGALNQMVGTIEPRPIVWENIKAAIANSAASQARPSPPVEPVAETAAPPVVAETPPMAVEPSTAPAAGHSADSANVILLAGRVKRWRFRSAMGSINSRHLRCSAEVGILLLRIHKKCRNWYHPKHCLRRLLPAPEVTAFGFPGYPQARKTTSHSMICAYKWRVTLVTCGRTN